MKQLVFFKKIILVEQNKIYNKSIFQNKVNMTWLNRRAIFEALFYFSKKIILLFIGMKYFFFLYKNISRIDRNFNVLHEIEKRFRYKKINYLDESISN